MATSIKCLQVQLYFQILILLHDGESCQLLDSPVSLEGKGQTKHFETWFAQE